MLYTASFSIEAEAAKKVVGSFVLAVKANSPEKAIQKFEKMIQKKYPHERLHDSGTSRLLITMTGITGITEIPNTPVELFYTANNLSEDSLLIDALRGYHGENIISFPIKQNTMLYYEFGQKPEYGNLRLAA